MKVAKYEAKNPYSIKDFVVDRVASGITLEESIEQLNSLFGYEITIIEFQKLFPDYNSAIEERQVVISEELEKCKTELVDRMNSLSIRLEKALDVLEKEKKYKYFAQVAGQLNRSFELIAKAVGKIKSGNQNTVNILSIGKDYLTDLEELEKMGVIKITDQDRIKKLYGVNEEVIVDATFESTTKETTVTSKDSSEK